MSIRIIIHFLPITSSSCIISTTYEKNLVRMLIYIIF